MAENKLTIWSNNFFTPEQMDERELLAKGAKAHRLLLFDAKENGASGASREALLTADIAFGQPDAEALLWSENLRWLHVSSAGYTAYERDDLKQVWQERGAMMTNSSGVYDEPCAQHLLAMIMALGRGLPFAFAAQCGNRDWQMHRLRPKLYLPNEQTAVIFGFGAIARRLVELLAPLKMNVVGVRRQPRGDEPVPMVDESEADRLLPAADHIINILPGNDTTGNYFNRERLALLKPSAAFYNIGRGTTVDQKALIESLKTDRLAAAYLDVTDPEPLPPEHELWTTPNCFITPHIAGGLVDEKHRQIKHFLENLRRFELGDDILNRIY